MQGGIVDQIAQHFLKVLLFTAKGRLAVAGQIDQHLALVDAPHGARDGFQRRPHGRAGGGGRAAAGSAGAGQLMIDMAAHHLHLGFDGAGQRIVAAKRFADQHAHRRFQRMGKIAGMAARRFRLGFAMRQQLVDFRHQRFHLHRELRFNPPRLAGTDGGNRL